VGGRGLDLLGQRERRNKRQPSNEKTGDPGEVKVLLRDFECREDDDARIGRFFGRRNIKNLAE